jgi:hemolysin activation/secretion protein
MPNLCHDVKKLLAVSSILFSMQCYAQVPDAGALQQQIDRERQQQQTQRITPEKPAIPVPMKPATGVIVTVKQFQFSGNTLLSAEQLALAVAAYLERPLDFSQLQAAAVAVAEAYRAAGWIVRAYFPEQDIKDGVVTIQVVEAVFGQLKHEGVTSERVSQNKIDAIFLAHQAVGAPVNSAAIDRALLLADDLPGVAVKGGFAPGSSNRQTDLIIRTNSEPIFTGDLVSDNSGSQATGVQRLLANVSLASPVGWGDQANLNVITTRGSDYGRLAYSVPAGSNGWRIGASASELRYRLIKAPQDPSTDKGSSNVIGLDASYPIIRSRPKNLYLNFNLDRKDFDNRISVAPEGVASRYTIDAYSLALNGNLIDNVGGGGANTANLALVSGRRAAGISTSGQHYTKLRYGLSRQQVITDDVALYIALSGQYARKNLDSSERFYLGGSTGIRAYPGGEAGGSSAYMTNLEVRWKLPERVTLTGFLDSGAVRNFENAGSNYSLSGAGITLAWKAPVGINLQATWARSIGDNPYPADVAESTKRNRFWLSVSLPF